MPTSTRTHLTIIPRTGLVSLRSNPACDGHSLTQRMVRTILYYRRRTSEVFPDNGGSGKDSTAGCANSQCVQANFGVVNRNLTAKQTYGLCLSALPLLPLQTIQESEFLWDSPQMPLLGKQQICQKLPVYSFPIYITDGSPALSAAREC